jgi:trans-2,3-dihydro-3-hydroxyanthranilate isomerase
MARSLPFFLVDVFADAPLTGNPLAVVADADDVDEDLMRAIAREFNQSETTFVLASTRQRVAWRLRSFTPVGVEVGGAGHNALGAWWWLAAAGRLALSDGANRFLPGDRRASLARRGDRRRRAPAGDRDGSGVAAVGRSGR